MTGKELMFVPFIEPNDWEGETWIWWLQATGNEKELDKLSSFVSRWIETKDVDWCPYILISDEVVPESTVNILTTYGNISSKADYYPAHNKVVGLFTFPAGASFSGGDPFFKGKIREYFR